MTDESAAAIPPADPAPGNESLESSSADPELLTRRVLLYEVLLEEYESHCPAGAAEPATPRPLPDALKEVEQPRLEPRDLETIRQEGEVERAKCAGIEGGRKRAEEEDKYNAGLASKFFTLLTKAQRAQAEAELGSGNAAMREGYLKTLTLAWDSIPKGERPSGTPVNYVERALAHEVYGFIDDLRERHRKATANIEDEESRKKEIDRRALESWLKGIREGEEARVKSKQAAQDAAAQAKGSAPAMGEPPSAAAVVEGPSSAPLHQPLLPTQQAATPTDQAATPADMSAADQQQPLPTVVTERTARVAEQALEVKEQPPADLLNFNDPELVQLLARFVQSVVMMTMRRGQQAATPEAEKGREDEPTAGRS